MGWWAGGPLEALEGCGSPGHSQPPKEQALLAGGKPLCLPSSTFSHVDSFGARRWRRPAREGGASCPLGPGGIWALQLLGLLELSFPQGYIQQRRRDPLCGIDTRSERGSARRAPVDLIKYFVPLPAGSPGRLRQELEDPESRFRKSFLFLVASWVFLALKAGWEFWERRSW